MKLSVVLATRNEEGNIKGVISSVLSIADEIIVMDESSTDKTREIAKKMGAHVFKVRHEPIFHVTKQKAINKASGDWIFQLDADERVTSRLAKEIKEVLMMSDEEILARRPEDSKKWSLFMRHQKAVEARDGKLGKPTGEVVAFFIPRRNYFLGKPLIHAGVYPDAVIRLIKRGKARLPAKSVHEQMEIDGEVAWLFDDLEHHDSPTMAKYVMRMNRYTDLKASEFRKEKLGKNLLVLFFYTTIKPTLYFFKLFVRHRGYLDGVRGFLWSVLSSLHYPLAYYKYWNMGS